MTTEEKNLLAGLAIAAVLVPITLGAALDWPTWSWLLLTVPLLGVLGLVARSIQRRVRHELPSQPYVIPSLPAEQKDSAQQMPIGPLTLPSAVGGYGFRFSATVCWRSAKSRTGHANLGTLAVDAILTRARTTTAAEHPNDVDVVQHQLASELGTVRRDTSGVVETWADDVQLTLSEADQQRLHKFSEIFKNERLWEYERNYERRKRDYLRNDVMKSTGSAVIWRLAQKDNDVEDAVRLIGPLAQLSAAANGKEVHELFRHLVPTPVPASQFPYDSSAGDPQIPNGSFREGSNHTIGFPWAGLAGGEFSDVHPVSRMLIAAINTLYSDDEQRALLARRFTMLTENSEVPDVAREIQRHFDASTTDKEPADLSEPDEDLSDEPTPDAEPPRREEPWRKPPLPAESEQDGPPQAAEPRRLEQYDEPHD